MDKYSVKLMSRALRVLDGIYDYIAETFLEPRTALSLVGRIDEQICSSMALFCIPLPQK